MENKPTKVELELGYVLMPCLALDADGTLRRSASGQKFIKDADDIELIPGVAQRVIAYQQKGYYIAVCSNQGGVAHDFKTTDQAAEEAKRTIKLLDAEIGGQQLVNSYHQEYFDAKGKVEPFNYRSLCRKPDYGMLVKVELYAREQGVIIDWANSLFVGDMEDDRLTAFNAGISYMDINDFLRLKPTSDENA